ncbi:MAG: hypothetical protein RhofKO_25020 [Rhodothermales bacterium]
MAISSLYVDPTLACVYVGVIGQLQDADYVAAFQAVLAHPDRRPEFAEVWNFLEVTGLAFTPEVLAAYRGLMQRYEGDDVLTRGRIAVLAKQEDIRTMTVLFDKISSGYVNRQIELFRDTARAEAWLSLPTGTFSTLQQTIPVVQISAQGPLPPKRKAS